MRDWIFSGLWQLPWWGYIVFVLAVTHVTIAGVTIYLHRCQAHRALELSPPVSHFFRFWLWLTTGMVTREWVAVHRKHHAKVETADDPHSPQVQGINKVLWGGVLCYIAERKNADTIRRYGYGAPSDWMERNFYGRWPMAGIVVCAALDIALFGPLIGMAVWVTQMAWIPFWAAGVINGIGHYWGYRNFQPKDESRNIGPIGLVIGGEELHNNHHAFPTSAKLSNRWYEFDVGWLYIRALEKIGQARIKRVAPRLLAGDARSACDLDTLQSLVANRFEVVTRFARATKKTCFSELARLTVGATLPCRRTVSDWLHGMENRLSKDDLRRIDRLLQKSAIVSRIEDMRRELYSLWEDCSLNSEQLVDRLRGWCARAEESGIEALSSFARDLRGYRLRRA